MGPSVTYGPWEVVGEGKSGPIMVQGRVRFFHQCAPMRRRRYEWWMEDGQQMGRWSWEYLHPPEGGE